MWQLITGVAIHNKQYHRASTSYWPRHHKMSVTIFAQFEELMLQLMRSKYCCDAMQDCAALKHGIQTACYFMLALCSSKQSFIR